MNVKIFNDFRKEYWFHVSDQNEIPIYGHAEKSIDAGLLYKIAKQISGTKEDKDKLKQIICQDTATIDTLRTIVGISDKRMYLELSYILNKYKLTNDSKMNILGESIYDLKKHPLNYFKKKIEKRDSISLTVLDIVVEYLTNRGILSVLALIHRMRKNDVTILVNNFLLPKEIQQEETKKRGHGAEQALARLLNKLNVSFIPDKRHLSPMSQPDPNVTKSNFEITARNEASTWSMDLVINKDNQPKVFIQSLIHTSDPGQYGVNKSAETVSVKSDLDRHNDSNNDQKELWGLVDGVGFIENPENTIFKMLTQFDNFMQLKSLYKAALRLHRLGLVKIRAIKFDMTFYSKEEANEMFELYGSPDIIKITDLNPPSGNPIEAGKAWLYL